MGQRSTFETILRGLHPAEDDDGSSEGGAPLRAAAAPCFVTERAAGEIGGDALAARYGETGGGQFGESHAPAAPPSVAPADVERELDLASCRSVEALQARRRAFARGNHPDRLEPRLAAVATERMSIANRLVDEAIARLGGRIPPTR